MKQGYPGLLGRRVRVWSAVATALFVLLAARLGWVQVIRHNYYSNEADNDVIRHWRLRAPRGNIYDRNGLPLALNLNLFSVTADPKYIPNPAAAAKQLAPILRMPEAEVAEKLVREKIGQEGKKKEMRFARLRENVDEPIAAALRKLNLPGLIVTRRGKRAYPHGAIAAALLGFVGDDTQGLGGIEARYQRQLAGEDGRALVMLDGRLPRSRTQIPDRTVVEKEMTPGSSVVLTIDMNLQAAADEALAKAVKNAHAKGGTAVVMDPRTGEVLALANQPSFDPNQFAQSKPATWVSQAVVSPFEPGSTFKTITACAALEEGVYAHGETVNCSGTRQVGNRTIGCARHGGSRAHGVVDLNMMIVKSCNVALGTVALQLGPRRLYHWVRKLGFGERTGIELPSESPGLLTRPESWSQIQVANVGFGQGVSVTALQLLAAYCAIANGGYKVQSRVVKLITTGESAQPQELPKPVRVLSSKTCDRMKKSLQGVVDEGTGEQAQIPGRRVAGKTGTAQKPTPEAGYHSGKYVGSFVGFAPVGDPRLAVIVVIDEPQGSHYGGVVAAPAFREIMERGLSYLHVPPDTKDRAGGGEPGRSVAE